ncbi:MAG: hypothetical protein R3E97_01655 [Candidatus Eisenbacteria bacterium]
MRPFMCCLLLVAVAASIGCAEKDWRDREPDLVAPGESAPIDSVWHVMADADEVTAYILDGSGRSWPPGKRVIGRAKATTPGPELTQAQRNSLISSLRTAAGGDCGTTDKGILEPDFGVRFANGDQVVDVVVSFERNIWFVYKNYAPVTRIGGSFDCVSDQIASLAQQTFPRHRAFRKISTEK